MSDRSIPLGKYCLRSPWVFSFEPILSTIAPNFPTDGGWRPVQPHGYHADRLAGHQSSGNLLALGQRQRTIRPVTLSGPDTAALGQDPANRGVMTIKESGNLVKRLATLPAIPHKSYLRFVVINLRSLGYLATLSLLAQSLVCCIDRLNPQSEADNLRHSSRRSGLDFASPAVIPPSESLSFFRQKVFIPGDVFVCGLHERMGQHLPRQFVVLFVL